MGENRLGHDASHHAKKVLRLKTGDAVELFDDAGNVGQGEITNDASDGLIVRIDTQAHGKPAVGFEPSPVHIASAVPKSSRADWMVEKLSELGVARFTPLATERAVVLPEGVGKIGRWQRIAEEAARQSGRVGVMAIDPLTRLDKMLAGEPGFFGSTASPAVPLAGAIAAAVSPVTILIGPEGGWSDAEIARLLAAEWRAVTLGPTVLRIETAAIAAAVIAMSRVSEKATAENRG